MCQSVSRVSIGSDNGLSPIRRQAIIWTNTGLLAIGTLRTNFSEIVVKIQNYSFTKKAPKHIVCYMAAILSRGRLVNVLGYRMTTKFPYKHDQRKWINRTTNTTRQPSKSLNAIKQTIWRQFKWHCFPLLMIDGNREPTYYLVNLSLYYNQSIECIEIEIHVDYYFFMQIIANALDTIILLPIGG